MTVFGPADTIKAETAHGDFGLGGKERSPLEAGLCARRCEVECGGRYLYAVSGC